MADARDPIELALGALARHRERRLLDRAAARGWLPAEKLETPLRQLLAEGALTDAQVAELRRELDEGDLARPARFRREGTVGEGSMAVVYRAVDEQLGRTVALKVLKLRGPEDAGARWRFEREARAAARLSHPNVVTLHDAVEENGDRCLVMEFVDGKPLKALLADRRAKRPELLEILRKAALGVQHAHEQGIVHRDLKPANVLVTDRGEPKVSDFGIAHLLSGASTVGASGSPVGTPTYMAPEQVAGRPVTPRTDVYALGAILYEMLAGRPPHVGRTLTDVYAGILQREPLDPRRIEPGVPVDAVAVCLKALEKDPARRYVSAAEFAEDLGRHLRGEPVRARPPTRLGALRRAIATRRTALVATVVGVVVVGLLIARQRRVDDELAQAVARERELRRRGEEDEASRRLVEQARPVVEKSFEYLYSREASIEEFRARLESARGLLEKAVETSPRLVAAHHLLGVVWELEGWEDRAERSLRRAVELDPTHAAARWQLGRLLAAKSLQVIFAFEGRPIVDESGFAERLGAEVKEQMDAAGAVLEDPLQRLLAAGFLARARGDLEGARKIAREGIERYGGRFGAEEFHWLAGLVAEDASSAAAAYDRAIEIRPRFAHALLCRGSLRLQEGDPARGLADLDEALRLHPRLAPAWVNRGLIRLRQGDARGAAADFDRALELGLEAGYIYCWRGDARLQLGDLEGALADAEETVRRAPAVYLGYVLRGTVHQFRGDAERALSDYDEAARLGSTNAPMYLNRGAIRVKRGEWEQALPDLDRALDLDRRYANAWCLRGLVRCHLGRHAEALPDFDEALRLGLRDARAFNGRGLCRAHLGDDAAALADFTETIRLFPEFPEAYANRADVHARAARYEEGVADMTEMVRRTPDHFEARCRRGRMLIGAGRWAEAIADFDEVLRRDPEHLDALVGRGSARLGAGDAEGAERDGAEALARSAEGSPERAMAEVLLQEVRRSRR